MPEYHCTGYRQTGGVKVEHTDADIAAAADARDLILRGIALRESNYY